MSERLKELSSLYSQTVEHLIGRNHTACVFCLAELILFTDGSDEDIAKVNPAKRQKHYPFKQYCKVFEGLEVCDECLEVIRSQYKLGSVAGIDMSGQYGDDWTEVFFQPLPPPPASP